MNLKKGKFLGAIVLSLFLLSSCRSLKNSNTLFQSEYDKFAGTAKSVYVANGKENIQNSYKIQPFDLVAVKNLQHPEGLATTGSTEVSTSLDAFKLDSAGIIALPGLGQVTLIGLTQTEAAKKIQDLYGKTLLKNPLIDLRVVDLKVTLLGEIAKPGNYQLERENFDLIDLLGKSGGFLPSSDAGKIKIIRGDRSRPEIIYVNLKNVNSLSNNKLQLHNDDIIYIPAKKLFNTTEGLKGYMGIIQPMFLVFNTIILLATLKNL